jgi:hypothetical protein
MDARTTGDEAQRNWTRLSNASFARDWDSDDDAVYGTFPTTP